MTRLDLTQWELRDFDPGAGGDEGDGWLPVSAPGDTYQALIAAGRLAHPFQGRGEAPAAWVRDREWWWRTSFEAPALGEGEIAELTFEGLDTFAHIHLDGRLLASTDNMFRRYVLDIGAHVRPGRTHRLAIRFDPPALAARPAELSVWSAFTDRVSRSKRNLIRKAQFGWGWDWGPDLPTVGVWQPARIEVRAPAAITDLRFETTAVGADLASAVIHFEVEAGDTVEITLTDPQGTVVFAHTGPAKSGQLPVNITRPQLWWTADLGAQPLYDLTVRLHAADKVVVETRRIGLRTIAIDESPDPDEPGATFFRFLLNGRPLFAKGACWVPATSFVGDLDPAAHRRLMQQSVAANMNMIRVWGGGIYEPDLFYDLCDELGLLVWQDFMFACSHYPDYPDFVDSVRIEVEEQVLRLRHHPSLAVWCGNNEIQAMHRINADLSGEDVPLSGAVLYDETIPQALARLDPATPYRPSSPFGGAHPNGMKHGDVHDWTVWHGLPPVPDEVMVGEYARTPEGMAFTRYAEDQTRFVSEFGIQAAPAMATLKRWMDPADLTLDSPGFFERIKDEARKADALMQPVTGLPTTLEDYVDYSQWTQAEGLKFGIEHFRRRSPHCSGALLWQLNDCWPCVSWSLIDYDGVEKASYHAVRRAFAPLLASFQAADGQAALWITNDTPATLEGEAVVSLERLDGQVIRQETVRWSAPSGGHAVAWTGPAPTDSGQILRAWSTDDSFEPNRLLAGQIKDVALDPAAKLAVSIARLGPNALRLEIAATVWTPFVHGVSERPDLRFDDNYFDLAAGESRIVQVTAPGPLSPHDLTVRSWTQR